jgi:hypothetical protein
MTRASESASTVEVRSHDQSLRNRKRSGVRSRDGATEELRNQADGHP